MRQQSTAGRRQHDSVASAVKQGTSDLVLERPNLPTHRGLGDVERLGCLTNAAEPGGTLEIAVATTGGYQIRLANVTMPPTDNKLFRQALNYALDGDWSRSSGRALGVRCGAPATIR